MKLSTRSLAIYSLIIVALGYALMNIAIRLMSMEFGTYTQTYLRIGLGFLFALGIFWKDLRFKNIKSLPSRDWLLLFIMGTFGYSFAVIFVNLGVLNTKLLNVSIIASTGPFFALLLSTIFLRKRFKVMYLLFLTISFLGVAIMATKSLIPVLSNFGIGELYTLGFAAGVGIFAVVRQSLSKQINNSEITVIVMLIAFITAFIASFFAGETLPFSGFLNPLALLGLAIGIFFNVLNVKLQNFAFSHMNSVAATQILLLENIFNLFIGYVLYREKVLPIELLGALLILIGVLAYNRVAKN